MPAVFVPIVTGSPNTATCNVSEGQTYFQIYVSAAVTLHFSFGNEQPHAKTVVVVFQQDGTGHTVSSGSEILVAGTIDSTASYNTVATYFYDEVSGGWFQMNYQEYDT